MSVPDVPSADVKVPKKGLFGKFLRKKSSKDDIDVSGKRQLGLGSAGSLFLVTKVGV